MASRISDQLNFGGHLRDNTNMKDDTLHSFILTRRIWKDDYGGKMIFGELVGLNFPYSVLAIPEYSVPQVTI